MFGNGPTLSDIAAVTGGNRNETFGGDGWWILIILFALFGGFGRGFGGFGGAEAATTADIQRGFDNQGITNKLNGLENAFASLGYDQLAQMNGLNTTVMQTGFGLQSSIDGGFNGLGRQLAECCCENRLLTTQQGYETRIQTIEQTNQLGSQADRNTAAITGSIALSSIWAASEDIATQRSLPMTL